MGESLAKTGEAKQPRLRKLLKDRATRDLRGALGGGRGQGPLAEASLVSVLEGPRPEGPPASPFCSEPSKATVMGEGQTVLLGLRMKRPGEGKGFLGERQEEEKGLEGEGGTQVPVYTARWGLGAAGWPGCREGKRAQGELGGWSWAQGLPSDNSAPARVPSTGLAWLHLRGWKGCPKPPVTMAQTQAFRQALSQALVPRHGPYIPRHRLITLQAWDAGAR